jgi:hypothetical protein
MRRLNKPTGRLQFSLRTLLLLTFGLALICAPVGWRIRESRRRAEAKEFIIKSGGTVRTNAILGAASFWGILRDECSYETTEVRFPCAYPTDEVLQRLQCFPEITSLEICGPKPGENRTTQVGAFLAPKFSQERRRLFTASGLRCLARLRNLHILRINQLGIVDSDVDVMANLPALTQLDLSYTDISDDALVRIARFTRLTDLELEGTRVTDKGLRELHCSYQLCSVGVSKTLVSGEAIKDFRQKLPECNIMN